MTSAIRVTAAAVLILLACAARASGAGPAAQPALTVEQVLSATSHDKLFPWATQKMEELAALLEGATDGSSARIAAPAAERCYMEMQMIVLRIAMLPRPANHELARLEGAAKRFEQARARLAEQNNRVRANPQAAQPLRNVVEPVHAQMKGEAQSKAPAIASSLQTLRSQIELYKLQHKDQAPDFRTHGWQQLTGRTDESGQLSPRGKFGPYLPAPVINPANGCSTVLIIRGTPNAKFRYDKGDCGFVLDEASGRIWALAFDGRVFDENAAFSSGR